MIDICGVYLSHEVHEAEHRAESTQKKYRNEQSIVARLFERAV